MAAFRGINALEQRVCDIVDDYIHEMYFENNVLAIGRRCGRLFIAL